jgi:hypothetical protein
MIAKLELTNTINNPTLKHLIEWVDAVNESITEEDMVLNTMDDLAMHLEWWRSEFCNPKIDVKEHQGDFVTVAIYGDELILVSDQCSGEYFKVTKP